MTYEIRKSGQTYCTSQIKDLGYTVATLRAMSAAGYHLYIDGKRAKLMERKMENEGLPIVFTVRRNAANCSR